MYRQCLFLLIQRTGGRSSFTVASLGGGTVSLTFVGFLAFFFFFFLFTLFAVSGPVVSVVSEGEGERDE